MTNFLLLLGITLFSIATYAQQTAKISGTVTDVTAIPVKGSMVTLLNTNRSALTNEAGSFTFDNLTPGSYTVHVSAFGYAVTTKRVVVYAGSNALTLVVAKAPAVLDEVVVTADKREQLLQEVPVSITSLSARQVQEYRLWNTNDLSTIVPNLYSADPGDRRNVTSIRGITTTSYDPAVATYIDGVNQFNLDTYIAQLFDVERIEVLRGPQGTLYGRNAMAGVINIITKQPQNKIEGFGEVTVGNYGLRRYSAGVRLPVVNDKLYFGVAGLYDRSNGFFTNQFNNSKYDKQNSFTGNYYLKFLPANKWNFTLNVKHNNNRNNGAFPLLFGFNPASSDAYMLNQNATTKLIDNIFNSSLSVNHVGRGISFTSHTAYQSNYRIYNAPIDADFSPIDGITLVNNYGKDWNKVKVVTQEFKVSSPASQKGRFTWASGTYLFYHDNPVKQATRFGNDAAMVGAPDKNFSLITTTESKSMGLAFYGQSTYSINSHFDITAGLRYDHEKKEQSVLGEYQKDPNPNPVFAYRPDTSATAGFNAVSPKLSAAYKFSDNGLLFVSFSGGFRAGGLTPLSSDPSQPALYPFKPEYSNNLEAGVKNTLLDKRLLLNFTAFYSAVNNAQVPTLVLPDAVTITRNTGKLRSKGVELETTGLFGAFQFQYNFGYTASEYKELNVAQNGSEVNLKGRRQIFTPDVTSMLAIQYSMGLNKNNTCRLIARGEWRYLGKQFFDLANTIEQGSYSLYNAKVGIEASKLSLMLWGRNLSNARYISYGYDFGALNIGDPNTYGATVLLRL